MNFRRSTEQAEAANRWKAFVATHHGLVRTTGLPQLVFDSEAIFIDLLMHGYLDHHEDPYGVRIAELPPLGYNALRDLAERYFADGFGWFSPIGLTTETRTRYESGTTNFWVDQ